MNLIHPAPTHPSHPRTRKHTRPPTHSTQLYTNPATQPTNTPHAHHPPTPPTNSTRPSQPPADPTSPPYHSPTHPHLYSTHQLTDPPSNQPTNSSTTPHNPTPNIFLDHGSTSSQFWIDSKSTHGSTSGPNSSQSWVQLCIILERPPVNH
jgi:hypothetical protein